MANKYQQAEFVPLAGETAREYTERLNAAGIGEFVGLEVHFGYSNGAAKGMWVASERFNVVFALEQWTDRRKRSLDGHGATNWLKRKYKLSDAEALQVAAEFERGNGEGLLSVVGFEEIARRRVMEKYVAEMEAKGAFS